METTGHQINDFFFSVDNFGPKEKCNSQQSMPYCTVCAKSGAVYRQGLIIEKGITAGCTAEAAAIVNYSP